MRFLHAADLHLDSPLRGLDRYDGAPVERLRTATRRALERLVERALDERVDFVVLAGDIYDHDWPDFRTGLFFRDQMVRLDRERVPVFIAHGNHDAQGVISRQLVLPSNVHTFSSRHAETRQLPDLEVAVHGRSFPARMVDEDLVPGYPAALPGWFNVGVLHTSLTGRAGHDTYAPTSLDTLEAKGYDYWALGHVHAREVVAESPRVVFPGCAQGRHANETGSKGCELVTVEAGRVDCEHLPLDVARWAQVTVAVDGIERLDALVEAVRGALDEAVHAAPDRLHAVRVTLHGRSALHAIEAGQPGTLAAAVRGAAQDVDGGEIWIEQVRLELIAPIDRAQVAARGDAVGELVRLVDELCADEGGLTEWAGPLVEELLRKLPPEAMAGAAIADLGPATLRALLLDAEATVLARLGDAA